MMTLLEDYMLVIAVLEADLKDCCKKFSEVTSSKNALQDKLEVTDARLKEAVYFCTVQNNRISSLEDEERWYRRLGNVR